jgi:hypothetical protein
VHPGSQWYNRAAAEIAQQELSLGPKGAKKYRLDLLRRVAKRVDESSIAYLDNKAQREGRII